MPFTDAPPAWDGSYPYLSISLTDVEAGPAKFNSAIKLYKATIHHDSPGNQFQVDLHSGMFVLRQTDLFLGDSNPVSLTRTYRPWGLSVNAFGIGATHPYDICPTGSRFPYTYMDLNLEDGGQVHFRRVSKGTGYADAVFRHEETSAEFYGAQVAWNGDGWTLHLRDGTRVKFPDSYYAKNCAQGAPFEIADADGHRIQLKRDNLRNLAKLISPSGRSISFKYDGDSRIVEAADDQGNVRKYSYDNTGHLEALADASHLLYRFEYRALLHSAGYDPYLMTAIFDGQGKKLLQNVYDSGGRITEQRLGNGEVYRYDYLLGKGKDIAETTVNGPSGMRKFFFDRGILAREQ